MSKVESSAASLGPLRPADSSQWPWNIDSPNVPDTISMDLTQATANVLQGAISRNPRLLNMTVADAAHLMGVPPSALHAAFDQLAKQTGVKLVGDDGAPRTIQAILSDVPQSQGVKLLDQWVKSLPPALQRIFFGVAVGVVLATEGLRGLTERFNLRVKLIEDKHGELILGLVPSSQDSSSVALNISGGFHFVNVSGSVGTDGHAQIFAGIRLGLGGGVGSINLTASGTGGPDLSVNFATSDFKLGVGLGNGFWANINYNDFFSADLQFGGKTPSSVSLGARLRF